MCSDCTSSAGRLESGGENVSANKGAGVVCTGESMVALFAPIRSQQTGRAVLSGSVARGPAVCGVAEGSEQCPAEAWWACVAWRRRSACTRGLIVQRLRKWILRNATSAHLRGRCRFLVPILLLTMDVCPFVFRQQPVCQLAFLENQRDRTGQPTSFLRVRNCLSVFPIFANHCGT